MQYCRLKMIKVEINNADYKRLTTPFINLEYKCNGCGCQTDNSAGYCGFCLKERKMLLKKLISK